MTQGNTFSPNNTPATLPPMVAMRAYRIYLEAMAPLLYPSAFSVPICTLCSSTILVMVVRLTKAATKKKMAGKTFVQYLNEYRIQMACRMLEKGEKSVSEVCYAVGFGDVPYFHRMFKRMTGTTPGKYKEDGSTE